MAFVRDYDHITHLIEEGKTSEARRSLAMILYRNSRDAQAWWLYAQVAEDDEQLRHILGALTELPANPYTALAKTALHKLDNEAKWNNANRPSMQNVAPAQKHHQADTTRQRSSRMPRLFAAFAGLVLLLVVSGAFIIVSSAGRVPASAMAAQPTTAVRQTQVVLMVTLPPQASPTPLPSVTPFPTSTPRPTAMSFQPTITPTPVLPDLADVLPVLTQSLNDHSVALDKVSDSLIASLSEPDKISIGAVQASAGQADQIRRLRNEITLLDLSKVSQEVRQRIILPAHTAYADYANSLLQWIDLQIQAYQAYVSVSQAPLTAVTAARQTWNERYALAIKQTGVVNAKRTTFDKALTSYNLYTQEIVLAAHTSSHAAIYTGTDSQSVQLAAGKYKVSYRVGAAGTLALVPADSGKTPKITLANHLTSGDQIIELSGGSYSIAADSVVWWAVAFDPLGDS
jgi:hypothetical protein